MSALADDLLGQASKYGLVYAFLLVGLATWAASWASTHLLRGRIPGAALAISAALALAYLGGEHGLADFPLLAGLGVLGGALFRDFTIVATAAGASLREVRAAGWVGALSLLIGLTVAFGFGVAVAAALGYTDPVALTTIGAGACTFIVGPITGGELGASSEVIALSIATGVVKTIFTTLATPVLARRIGLTDSRSALVFGGLIGTTSGVAAGLAATDPRLVPYGALTATFYSGIGVLLCPSLFHLVVLAVFG